MNLFTERIEEKHNSLVRDYAKRKIHRRVCRSCLGYSYVAGIQGCYFINEARAFSTGVKTSMDWKRRCSGNEHPSFYTCLTVKGTESRKCTVLQSKQHKSVSSQMWTPKKSVVVKPPDLEIKGKCLANKHDKDNEAVDMIPKSVVDITAEQSFSVEDKDILNQRQEANQDVENSHGGKIFLAILKASLKKKLSPEYIDIIPSGLNRSVAVRSPQLDWNSTTYSRLSPRHVIKEDRLPAELKFGVRNPKKVNFGAVLKRPVIAQPKTELNYYRGKLEPLLPRKIPSKNLHAELEREEANNKTATWSTWYLSITCSLKWLSILVELYI